VNHDGHRERALRPGGDHVGDPRLVAWLVWFVPVGAGGFLLGVVVSSALTWYYDVLLLKLTPEGYQLTLWS
jgi:hypothetical protein